MAASQNFIRNNKKHLKSLEPGLNSKPRLELHEGYEPFNYGGQKMNIYEMQKEQVRKTIAGDKEHFYTYSKEYLSGAFPLVNEHEARVKAKVDSEARWLTKNGFDNLNKRQNWNEHPKKPDPAKLEDLRYPAVKQANLTKAKLA